MAATSYSVATLYKVGDETKSVEKTYWHRATAQNHFNQMRGRPGITAMVLEDQNGTVLDRWSKS